MKQLTKAEEEVMQILWQLQKANVASLITELPEPKPAYNTVSTIVRISRGQRFCGSRKSREGACVFSLGTKIGIQ